MMISPNYFYEENLKGKSAKEILTVIRSLKRKINRLKNIMEHPDYEPTICPGEDVQISCNRDYLERAKQALAEVGGVYTPSRAELKAEELKANLPFLSKVEFGISGYFTGSEDVTYIIEGDTVTTDVKRFDYNNPPKEEPIAEEEMDKETLIDGLARLHIGEWRRKYDDSMVCDGTQWDLKLYFSNGKKPIKIYGSNLYPYNFNRLLELFDIRYFSTDDSCCMKNLSNFSVARI